MVTNRTFKHRKVDNQLQDLRTSTKSSQFIIIHVYYANDPYGMYSDEGKI